MKLTQILTVAAISLTMVGMATADPKGVLKFDIVENGSRFSPDDPVNEDGIPLYGSEFVTEGYLYPYGFLDDHPEGGVNEDGSPTFPDEVLGRWTCRGWHVGEGGLTETGPWVVSHQLFDLKEAFGTETITTDGYELADENEPCDRAITGGTGKDSTSRGDSTQVFLGFNVSYGVNIRVELRPSSLPKEAAKPDPKPKKHIFGPWWKSWWK